MRREYSTTSSKERVLRTTGLTEVRNVRYADDFKLFCRDRASAEKMFQLVKIFLKDRLKLDISEKKSKIVNLRKGYSQILDTILSLPKIYIAALLKYVVTLKYANFFISLDYVGYPK